MPVELRRILRFQVEGSGAYSTAPACPSIRTALHIANRDAIAAFILVESRVFAAYNPFSQTNVGSPHQIWTGYQREFAFLNVASLSLGCLMAKLRELPDDTCIVQEILQAGGCRSYVYHHGDGCRIVGAVLGSDSLSLMPAALRLRISMMEPQHAPSLPVIEPRTRWIYRRASRHRHRPDRSGR